MFLKKQIYDKISGNLASLSSGDKKGEDE